MRDDGRDYDECDTPPVRHALVPPRTGPDHADVWEGREPKWVDYDYDDDRDDDRGGDDE